MQQVLYTLSIIVFSVYAHTQNNHFYNPSINIEHYQFEFLFNDTNDTLNGKATITVFFLKPSDKITFDLTNRNDSGKGMMVLSVKENKKDVIYEHTDNRLQINLNATVKPGDKKVYQIIYTGIPADGLIFSKNKFGSRTIFSDNWPNRAHNWLPCVDHPSDKASAEFIITAPDHYQVISNGVKIEETNLQNHLRLTHWKEEVLLPVKVMAVGIAEFAVNYAGDVGGIPVYSYVFPQEKQNGFNDYAQAVEILPFYIKQVGAYPYKKLANVQSKTIFGGMENANTIFYSQNSITGKRKSEALLAHEIAHQWFGDAVTEIDWPHLWLSEGFATEMTNLYLENKYGLDTVVSRLKNDREDVITFSKQRHVPVVDTTVSDYMKLLNENSYQKGGWVLHMLRRKLGDTAFWKSIRTYYATYAGRNAGTDDLRKVFERVSNENLQTFFKQWLYTAGHPRLNIAWKYNSEKKRVLLKIEQLQNGLFEFPLEIKLLHANASIVESLDIKQRITTKEISFANKPVKVIADPNINLLFEAEIYELK